MTSADVLEILATLEAAGVDACVDGGWGVDALVGTQTRSHADLDLALTADAATGAAVSLSSLEFVHDQGAQPGLPARLVLRDRAGRQVDLHRLQLDDAGNGWQALGDGAWGLYPAGEFNGVGTIAGHRVRCISAELQLRFHLGWEWDDKAKHDLRLLRSRFGIPLPPCFADAEHA